MDLFSRGYNWFWNERFWLPENYTFKDIENHNSETNMPIRMRVHFPLAVVVMLFLRFLHYRIVGFLCKINGVVDNRPTVKNVPELHACYRFTKRPSESQIDALTKRVDMSQRQIYVWFQNRRSLDKPGLLQKIKEGSWRCLFYAFISCFGIWTLWSAPWLWDVSYCWKDFPLQTMQTSVVMYYLFELSFYTCLLITALHDVRRLDFKEQVIHHLATVALLSLSYVNNSMRIGSLVMISHDVADVFLEGCKCFNYLKRRVLADIGFICFVVAFCATRLCIFPFHVIRAASFSIPFARMCPSHILSVAFLLLLQILHLFWAQTIFAIVKKVLMGEHAEDSRSDVEGE